MLVKVPAQRRNGSKAPTVLVVEWNLLMVWVFVAVDYAAGEFEKHMWRARQWVLLHDGVGSVAGLAK